MPALTLSKFIESLPRSDVIELGAELSPVLEPTEAVLDLEEKGKVVRFRLRGWVRDCVAGVLGSRGRVLKVLGAESDVDAYRALLNACSSPSKPVEKSFGNFFEAWRGGLERLPFIKFFPRDGGRYLTSSIVVACLDEVCNASIHRVMLVDSSTLVMRVVPRHLHFMHLRALERGEELPIAIVVGAPPQALIASASSPPYGVFELEVANTISELEVCRTPIHNLPVPCSASFVIEARLGSERHPEGPFVDLLKLYDKVRDEPVAKVDAIYLGVEPSSVVIPSGAEHRLLQSFYREALVWDAVRKVVPRVCGVRLGGGSWLSVYVAVDKQHDGDSKNALAAAMAAHPSAKIVVVLDCDVDLDDPRDVEWAIATRLRASQGVVVVKRARCSTLDPSTEDGLCDKLGIDATVGVRERERFRKARP
ncbi:MAG: UbiD family decarboxylase [Crenarchaeota archaeon]|nr:UbiD family decarboxylase [Thermoproteota archaeon]